MRRKLQYPRRVFIRNLLKFAGRVLGAVLARPNIRGTEHLPAQGPLILVGNHVAVIEAGMMAIYAPYMVELMAAGDIPLDPRYAWMADLYGIIPIKRGSMDREGMDTALSVLEQGGVIGLFPEGGIWETNIKQARTGVAWLSHKAQAPVVPIGFGGMEGALNAIWSFQRPCLTMNIGKPIPPVTLNGHAKSRKELLAENANQIMDQVTALIPEEERQLRSVPYFNEQFEFLIHLRDENGNDKVEVPAEMRISESWALSKFFHRPVMMDVFTRNLRLPVKALNQMGEYHPPADIVTATQAILDYLATNPYFLEYRFGHDEGSAMRQGITELHAAAVWLHNTHPVWTMRLKPIRRYTLRDTQQEVIEDQPGKMQMM